MTSLNASVTEYKNQLALGHIKQAYKGIIVYIMDLSTYFKKSYPEYYVSNLYQGYMDMSYFAIIPGSFKSKKLKIAIVFIHEKIKFEVWLSAANKDVQSKYWKLFKQKDLKHYNIPPTIKGYDSIIELTLVENPNFDNSEELTKKIESGTIKFIAEISDFLNQHQL